MTVTLNIIDDQKSESCDTSPSIKVQGRALAKQAKEFRGRAAVVTLGCAKNQVDSEVMLGVLKNSGFEIVTDLNTAEVVVVNTCGFLEASVKESLDCVLEVSELKETANLRRLIVAGCMVSRYKGDLKAELPEVDEFITSEDLMSVAKVASGAMKDLLSQAERPYFLYDERSPRIISDGRASAYVKISEGCNRPCTFCIIPKIRGEMRSRSIGSVVHEVKALAAQGVREINLVAQDLTNYGSDIKAPGLTDLLKELDSSAAVDWIRLLYAYPIGIEAPLLKEIETLSSVCNYLDMPLQHSSEPLLKLMKRPLGRFSPRNVIRFIRETAPTIHLRTTFIVGFPGESEADIADLEDFIREGHFTNVGIFTYSREEGTPSYDMPNQVTEEEKNARRERLMLAQQQVVAQKLKGFVGKTLKVLVEGTHQDTDLLLTGRTEFQAPEVDGVVIINDILGGEEQLGAVKVGEFYQVEITEVAGYDLVGRII